MFLQFIWLDGQLEVMRVFRELLGLTSTRPTSKFYSLGILRDNFLMNVKVIHYDLITTTCVLSFSYVSSLMARRVVQHTCCFFYYLLNLAVSSIPYTYR